MTRRPSRRLRVAYVVPDLGVGGAERHVATLMPALDPSRFDPLVICIGEEGALFADLVNQGVYAVAFHRRKHAAIGAILDLVSELRRLRPDIVIVRGYNAEVIGRIAAQLARVAVSIVWVHNCGDIAPRGRYRRWADRILDHVTDGYFAVARAQVDYMVDDLGYPRRKITVIHNGVDADRFDPSGDRLVARELGIPDESPIVGVLAAMRPEKDHALLLDAAALVVSELPATRFLLVGDGPMRSDLVCRVDDLGIAKHVVFAGTRSDVPEMLRAIDVFVLCSYSIECFPMALLEAMAAGRPAVCTAVGGVPEMIVEGQTGHLVPPRDPLTLADRLVAILRDQASRERMGAAARRRVEAEFSLGTSVEATERALERVAHLERQAAGNQRPIVLTVVLDLTFVGGVEILLLNLFREFDPALVRPRIVCLRELGPLGDDFRTSGFEVRVLKSAGRVDPRRLKDLVNDLRQSRTDVVLVPHHHRAALLLGRVAAQIAAIPNVVAAHDMDLTAVGGRVLPRWAVSTLCLSDALVLLTSAQGRYLHVEEGVGRGILSNTRETVIPNGIVMPDPSALADRERARSALGLDESDFAIGIVARLSPQKAHEVLFAAVSSLLRTRTPTRLFVIGGGERETELRSLARDLGIDGVITFTGVRRDVQRILLGLDAACLSSVHEGVPITIIEAMAAGLPIVATDCGSLRDMVSDGHEGFLVQVGDAAAMADRLRRLADDSELRARLGTNARTRAEQEFSISGTARAYEQLLVDIAGRKGRA